MKSVKVQICLLLACSQLPLSAAMVVFPEKRRTDILSSLEAMIAFEEPNQEELLQIPDPFVFGREIQIEEEEEKPIESLVPGFSNQEVLEMLAITLQSSLIGYQEFDGRSYLATKDFGLLREGDTVTIPLPKSADKTATVTIHDPTRKGFLIRMKDLSTYVFVKPASTGVSNSRP
ncbi:MAG: hypothetical protein ACQKBT_11745 [Puniceicoccales bacterium]